ncbi:unnamed protein product [Adineta ricciae]|uniref:Uncharacterized protein n=1 Tax=Adineta ricciae TaxID=249248 RepID=A0A815JJ47_ADIRI|nr:unnamed protein product [Adineta ricciae]
MNTSYMSNSSPNAIPRNKYLDSLMDFSTPMSGTSKHPFERSQSSTVIEMTDKHQQETIVDQLQQKFREHEMNFQQTQTYLHSLDEHLRELTVILNQLQQSFAYHSLLKPTAEQLETRLLQMSTKREQIRLMAKNLYQSPTISQTLNDIIQQISPSSSKLPSSMMDYYGELINAGRLSMNQKNNLIERFHHEQIHRKHRTNDHHLKIQQRQEILLQLIEKLHEQHKQNERSIEIFSIDKPQFDHHNEQFTELNKLIDEYQILQDENRLLKSRAKENIKALYTVINQTVE